MNSSHAESIGRILHLTAKGKNPCRNGIYLPAFRPELADSTAPNWDSTRLARISHYPLAIANSNIPVEYC